MNIKMTHIKKLMVVRNKRLNTAEERTGRKIKNKQLSRCSTQKKKVKNSEPRVRQKTSAPPRMVLRPATWSHPSACLK